LQQLLSDVRAGRNLAMSEMASLMGLIMDGDCSEDQIASLLLALRDKGPTVEEIAGAAQAMRGHMTPIRSERDDLIDTCGTGGDSSGTFNISTAAALVTAAAGLPVAKHGNRAVTSRSGSADVLAELGVNVEASVPQVETCLRELGICFCFAPNMHPSMRHVAAVRKRLGVPTIFNLLGPLCNPASAPCQLLGVGEERLRPLLAGALNLLGTRQSVVVCGTDGLDEVTLAGPTRVTRVGTGRQPEELTWQPGDFGFRPAGTDSMEVRGPAESAQLIRGILRGTVQGPPREIVLANAAAALHTAGHAQDLVECTRGAAAAIDSGAALDLLANLVRLSHSP
jgi:anthranilate phosphoribosyltransferase